MDTGILLWPLFQYSVLDTDFEEDHKIPLLRFQTKDLLNMKQYY